MQIFVMTICGMKLDRRLHWLEEFVKFIRVIYFLKQFMTNVGCIEFQFQLLFDYFRYIGKSNNVETEYAVVHYLFCLTT